MKNKKPYRYVFFTLMLIVIAVSCKQVPFTAPDGSTLIVTINPAIIPLGGEAQVQVMGYKAAGAPLPDGTVIYFSSNIGTIDSSAETTGGVAFATFKSDDGMVGTAHIRISSGNVDAKEETYQVEITSAELASLWITANPVSFEAGGGNATIMVTAYDYDMKPMADIPVVLKSDAGLLERLGETLYTDSNGQITDILQTETTATVTAVSGSVTSSVTINVESNEPPDADFVFSPPSPQPGQTVYFNASGSTDDRKIVQHKWDFGDGSITYGERVNHTYYNPGSYVVLLTVTDDLGEKGQKTTTVTVKLPGA